MTIPNFPDLLYEDHELLIVNKPAGLLTHPSQSEKKEHSLATQLQSYCKTLSTVGGEERSGIVHRLDRDTEGLLIIAKDNETHQTIKEQFQNKTIEKHYYAIVKGNVIDDEFTINLPIARHPRHRVSFMVSKTNPKRRDAISIVKVIKRFGTKTLVDIQPLTGRTHQIRVHLSHFGYPLLGDPVYGKTSNTSGQLLQAYSLQLTHPKKHILMKFTLPISKRFGINHL
jgi:23S rRNA pseudouridine1911/1915/1917 synthase